MALEPDVVIVGAGVAGLAAAGSLTRAGVNVQVIEARERIGGRIFTVHEPDLDTAIELGAEFIHGRPPQIFDVLRRASSLADEVTGTDWCVRNGQIRPCDFFDSIAEYLEKMKRTPEDESFLDFTQRCCPGTPNEVKRMAVAYVEGFNAARAEQISVNSLVQSGEAEERIDGDRAYRLRGGYDFVPRILLAACNPEHLRISFGAAVREVTWTAGGVTLNVASGGTEDRVHAPRALFTLPLGVWKSGAVAFRPALEEKESALSKLVMGSIIRVTLQFRERFWESAFLNGKDLSDLRFLFSEDEWFPTWWTSMPVRAPVITAWAPPRAADRLTGRDPEFVIQRAVQTLSAILGESRASLNQLLERGYTHDWELDPFSRGAYSYVQVGGEDAPATLAEPLERTLYFAGEATDIQGYFGTVHGAIASGERAAGEILQTVR